MITDKDELDAKIIIDMVGGNSDKWREIRDYTQRIRAESAEQARKDYQDVIDDYRRLTKDLDIALNGDCAAKQASLCDIVAQVRSLGTITEIIMRSAEQARKEAADRAVDFLKKEWYWFNDDACYANELRNAILGDSVAVSTDAEKLGIKNNIDGKCNEIIDRAKTIGGNYYKDVLFLCTEIAMITSTGKLAIAVKALEKIQKQGTYNPLGGRTLSGERIDSEKIINEYGIIARDALKEIQG